MSTNDYYNTTAYTHGNDKYRMLAPATVSRSMAFEDMVGTITASDFHKNWQSIAPAEKAIQMIRACEDLGMLNSIRKEVEAQHVKLSNELRRNYADVLDMEQNENGVYVATRNKRVYASLEKSEETSFWALPAELASMSMKLEVLGIDKAFLSSEIMSSNLCPEIMITETAELAADYDRWVQDSAQMSLFDLCSMYGLKSKYYVNKDEINIAAMDHAASRSVGYTGRLEMVEPLIYTPHIPQVLSADLVKWAEVYPMEDPPHAQWPFDPEVYMGYSQEEVDVMNEQARKERVLSSRPHSDVMSTMSPMQVSMGEKTKAKKRFTSR